MTTRTAVRPPFALALGAVFGGVLLALAVLMWDEHSPWDIANWRDTNTPDLDAFRRSLFLKSLLIAIAIGSLCGALIAGAIWTVRTDRPVPLLLPIASWWLLGAVGGLLAATGVLLLPMMSQHLNVGRDGSGGPGVALLIFGTALAGFLVGSLVGLSIGIVRALRRPAER